jgi:hypothetical protein
MVEIQALTVLVLSRLEGELLILREAFEEYSDRNWRAQVQDLILLGVYILVRAQTKSENIELGDSGIP